MLQTKGIFAQKTYFRSHMDVTCQYFTGVLVSWAWELVPERAPEHLYYGFRVSSLYTPVAKCCAIHYTALFYIIIMAWEVMYCFTNKHVLSWRYWYPSTYEVVGLMHYMYTVVGMSEKYIMLLQCITRIMRGIQCNTDSEYIKVKGLSGVLWGGEGVE
jgi:hypothetical protein